MLKPYAGGTIVGIRAGWDTKSQKGDFECFVREDFNGEDLSTGQKAVNFGWNVITMSDYVLPENPGQLIVGFTTRLKKGVCSIPTFYPHDVANSCYLWVEGENTSDGKPRWDDMKEKGILPIFLVLKDTQGTFNSVPLVTTMMHNGIVMQDEASDCLIGIRNNGSQAIRNLEFTTRQGEQVFSKKVTLSKAIASGCVSSLFLAPLYAPGSGPVEFSITKANDIDVTQPEVHTTSLITIPSDVASRYLRRPLVEYYESENSYMAPRYYDEIVYPGIRSMLGQVTYVSQHLDDQFMTGDDDATRLALQLCDEDSSAVSIPAMTIDRAISTDNISFQLNSTSSPMFNVLYEPYSTQSYRSALNHPTFVAVEASGALQEDEQTLDVVVEGDIAEGILYGGEHLRLTVYLMERNVDSDSQLFWSDDEKTEHEGHYTHVNIIREVLTEFDGYELTSEGAFRATFQTELFPEWKTEDLYLVAFVHRSANLGGHNMHVLNSAEGEISLEVGIHPTTISFKDATVFDLSGRRLADSRQLRHGLYLVGDKKVIVK